MDDDDEASVATERELGLPMERLTLFLDRFIVSLSFLSLLTTAIARGGDPSQHPLPGVADAGDSILTRQLFEEKEPVITDEMAGGYMSNSELEEAMKEFSKRCANISRMYSIGKSVKGFPLWVMEISDKAGEEEPEPAFKFIGNVHGDEPVGRELLMLLANWLCDNYMKDPLATLIIKNIHLHILPTMNPDGFALRRRGNANNVDLNRNFPDKFFPMNDIMQTRQPETRAIMTWVKEGHFTASASLHGGALVANYPWDGSEWIRKQYNACPDDRTFRYMARVYSNSHYNMSLSKEFEGGITNGALWYPIYGGMQDWNYIHGGCFELTLEISDNKWPPANELPVLWEYNRKSMINLVASVVKTGIHGRVFSKDGHPLPASVMIKGINSMVNASSILGDYHRMLAPGAGKSYQVSVSLPGFQQKTTQILMQDSSASLDFILEPEDSSKIRRIPRILGCRCDGTDKLELVQYLRGIQLEIYIVVSICLFLFILFKRKWFLKLVNQRHIVTPKRSIV
ncbi:hypothetical protein ZIOFF_021642 [Zingiber officinale]|uniref:Peptidase M14 domain-containing protein n=2 Tax=Zingiber officinale TaxID=94328 RepID=A0A8J5LJP8_ZINOF|nr:hypothetical protein ZIOFF_021642 [Zingiber officinale]